jgi:hypothetical protein
MSTGTPRAGARTTHPDRAILDVSEVAADRVREYARESAAAGHPDVYLERKGGRTFLVAD